MSDFRRKMLIKKDGKLVLHKDLTESEFEEINNALIALEDFSYVTFLSVSYLFPFKNFSNYDFSAPVINEVEAYSIFYNAIAAIATNIELWEKYLKNHYKDNEVFFPNKDNEKLSKDDRSKSIFSMRDSDIYDKNVEYVVTKNLRNRVIHLHKPYSNIIYFDDNSRHFLIYSRDLLADDKLSKSARRSIIESKSEFFDLVDILVKSFKLLTELNNFIYKQVVNHNWIKYYTSRLTMIDFLPKEYDGACLAWENTNYEENSILRIENRELPINAMHAILRIAANSLM